MSELVSVIIPVYNGEKYLEETIHSVLSQDYGPIEVIAIDDGSTDSSAKLLQAVPGITVIEQRQAGNAAARNMGVKLSKGDFVAFIDQDDVWREDKLSKQIECLRADPALMITLSFFTSFIAPGIEIPKWCRKETFEQPKPDYSPSSLVVRRDVFDLVGLFDEGYQSASDVDWFFQARDKGVVIGIVNEVLHQRRVHEGNQSHGFKRLHQEMLTLVRKSVHRKVENQVV